jgi:AcrR family transcriptional regulator
MSETEAPRGYAKGRERREKILTAANEVFANQGFNGASLSSIAERVGLSEPGLLHHFRSKEELLLEVLKLRHQHDGERVERATAETRSLPDALLDLCRENATRPGLVRLFTILAAEGVDPDHPAHDWFQERYRELRRKVVAQVTEAQRLGDLPPELDPVVLTPQILAMFDGLQLQWLLDPDDVDMVEVFEDYIARLRVHSR